MKRIQKACALFATLGLAASLFAQEADDGFVVPLDQDLSKAISEAPAQTANQGGGIESGPKIKQGLWTEIYSDNVSLIRNVSDGKTSGYEFDNAHFVGEANWWFWGEINKYFTLDAEISVLNFNKTLYQANTYGANVPDVTWGDGFQTLLSMPFSIIKNGNDETAGAFNKFGLNLATPFVDVRIGYGKLKKNGMSTFKGIFTTIDWWESVEDGYTELKNGRELREFGDIKIDALVALSQMRSVKGNPYGMYDYLDVKYADLAEVAVTFGSVTSEEQLFFYNRTNKNAISFYGAVNLIDHLKIEGHYLGSFGTGYTIAGDTSAGAGKISWTADTWNVSVMQSIAGVNVDSVWGSEEQVYDDINVDTMTTQLDAAKSFALEKLPFTVGLDQGVTFNDTDNLSEGLLSLRTQPYADFDLSALTGMNLTAGVYGVVGIDRLAKETSEDRDVTAYLDEAGVELTLSDVAKNLKKLRLDYALTFDRGEWNGSAYPVNTTLHSIMANADLTDRYNVHAGSIVRASDDSTIVPFACAVGFSVKHIPFPGKPMLWVHATYSMNPYEDNNYSLFRADDPLNRMPHRTYLLNTLDNNTTSHVSIGMIWDL